MSNTNRSNGPLFWAIGVIVSAMVVFVYLFISDAPKTVPKINLSYFVDEQEVVDSVTKRLAQEISGNRNYWIGIEPERAEQYPVVIRLVEALSKIAKPKKVLVDAELALPQDIVNALGASETVAVKDNTADVGQRLNEFEKNSSGYILITASIYSTSLLKDNPLHKFNEKYQPAPMTFSFALFADTPENEGKLLFKCDTEDHSGTRDWGCFSLNKARAVRRKIDQKNSKPWMGLMDLTGERDYAILLKKK